MDAALLRQVLYGTARLGLFRTFSEHLKAKKGRNLTLGEKAGASISAGFIASLIGNPADVSLVRFQTDSLAPAAERRNYKHVGDALTRMVKEEGVLSLWRGSGPTILRAVSMNLGMLATYDQVKEMLNERKGTTDDVSTRCISSAIAGVVCSTMSLPFDNVKTKLQRMKAGPDGKMPYNGVVDCFKKSILRENFLGLWVGLPTYIVRVSPHAIITLLVQDFLHHNFGAKTH